MVQTNQQCLLPNRQPVVRVMPYPKDTNTLGDIFGGWIMSHVDVAGAVVASRRARARVVTVSVNAFQFKEPVYVGDLVSCYAEVTRVGNTSIMVEVEVYAERGWRNRDSHSGECIKVTEATLTYVAMGDDGRPVSVPED